MDAQASKHKLLITGAAGRIGTFYRQHLAGRYTLRLVDHKPVANPGSDETMLLNLAEPEAAQQACAGMDTVLHLAANPSPSAEFYKDLLDANFKTTYNIFKAAKDQNCMRVIFASSVNAILGYPENHQARRNDAPCPANVYGVSKAFGESLGAYFAHVEGLSNICIRIGGVGTPERIKPDGNNLAFFVSHNDLCQLFDRCIEAQNIRFAVVHGVSNNRFQRMDVTETSELLDYHPQDDAFAIAGIQIPELR